MAGLLSRREPSIETVSPLVVVTSLSAPPTHPAVLLLATTDAPSSNISEAKLAFRIKVSAVLFCPSIAVLYVAEMAAKSTKASKENRPERPPKEKRLHTIGLRVSDRQLEELRDMADAEQRALAAMVSVLVWEAVAARRAKKS